MNHTPPAEVERFFEELGVPLKVERGNRVFPQSDKAADIIDALFYELKRLKVPVLQTRVTGLEIQEDRVVVIFFFHTQDIEGIIGEVYPPADKEGHKKKHPIYYKKI